MNNTNDELKREIRQIINNEGIYETPSDEGLDEIIALIRSKENDACREKYQELLYAVATKFPDETRHETALRYINNIENRCSGVVGCEAQPPIEKEKE